MEHWDTIIVNASAEMLRAYGEQGWEPFSLQRVTVQAQNKQFETTYLAGLKKRRPPQRIIPGEMKGERLDVPSSFRF